MWRRSVPLFSTAFAQSKIQTLDLEVYLQWLDGRNIWKDSLRERLQWISAHIPVQAKVSDRSPGSECGEKISLCPCPQLCSLLSKKVAHPFLDLACNATNRIMYTANIHSQSFQIFQVGESFGSNTSEPVVLNNTVQHTKVVALSQEKSNTFILRHSKHTHTRARAYTCAHSSTQTHAQNTHTHTHTHD